MVWHAETALRRGPISWWCPPGFLRRLFALWRDCRAPMMDAVKFAVNGGLVLGVCNSFDPLKPVFFPC